jgi:hypothetical protein
MSALRKATEEPLGVEQRRWRFPYVLIKAPKVQMPDTGSTVRFDTLEKIGI